MTSPDITIQTMSHLFALAERNRIAAPMRTKARQRYCYFAIYTNLSVFLCTIYEFTIYLTVGGIGNRNHINFLYSVRRLTCSEIIWCSSSMGTRSCFIVSRKRTVTQLSSNVSWSTVMQNGVPMAS